MAKQALVAAVLPGMAAPPHVAALAEPVRKLLAHRLLCMVSLPICMGGAPRWHAAQIRDTQYVVRC